MVDIISHRLADAPGPSFGSSLAMRGLIYGHVERAHKYGKLAFGMAGGDLSLRDVKAVDTLTWHDCAWIGEHRGSPGVRGVERLCPALPKALIVPRPRTGLDKILLVCYPLTVPRGRSHG